MLGGDVWLVLARAILFKQGLICKLQDRKESLDPQVCKENNFDVRWASFKKKIDNVLVDCCDGLKCDTLIMVTFLDF